MSTPTVNVKTTGKTTGTNTVNLKKGTVLSEISHYVYGAPSKKNAGMHILLHTESGTEVELTERYISDLLTSADQFAMEIKVGREDKIWTEKQINDAEKEGALKSGHQIRPGDLRLRGIRTIFEDIYDSTVATFCYKKQDEKLTKAAYDKLVADRITACTTAVENAKSAKKGIATAALKELNDLITNPILKVIPGEERILTGYKIQFKSRDGRYDCVDMMIDGTKESNVRPVNINTLLWIIYKGVKYVLE